MKMYSTTLTNISKNTNNIFERMFVVLVIRILNHVFVYNVTTKLIGNIRTLSMTLARA